MSDEEKKAIESFKEENNNNLSRFDDFNSYTQFKVKRDKLIIDLIEKQSKEIEELKEKNEFLNWYFENQKENFIHKDKIKAKIEYCREILYSFEKELELKANKDKFIHKESMNCLLGQISILQSLLEKE